MFTRSSLRSTFDLVFALLCAGPLTVTFWRGTFNALTEMVFGDLTTLESRWQPAFTLYIMGTFMKITIDLTKHSLRNTLINKGSVLQTFFSTILLYLDAFFGVVMWVGGFNLLYVFPGLYWFSLTGVLLISCFILIIIKAFHGVGGVPLNISIDEFENIFDPCNYFGTKLDTDSNYKLILDTIFTYGFVHTLVICCWWGLWELENRYILFPCEITVKDIQAWDSVIIAYFMVFVVVAINNNTKEDTREEERICSKSHRKLCCFSLPSCSCELLERSLVSHGLLFLPHTWTLGKSSPVSHHWLPWQPLCWYHSQPHPDLTERFSHP